MALWGKAERLASVSWRTLGPSLKDRRNSASHTLGLVLAHNPSYMHRSMSWGHKMANHYPLIMSSELLATLKGHLGQIGLVDGKIRLRRRRKFGLEHLGPVEA